jgi:hypothetical protein
MSRRKTDRTDCTGQTEEPGNTDTFKVTGHEDGRLSRACAISFVVTCLVETTVITGAGKGGDEEEGRIEEEGSGEEEGREEEEGEQGEQGEQGEFKQDEVTAGKEEHPQL